MFGVVALRRSSTSLLRLQQKRARSCSTHPHLSLSTYTNTLYMALLRRDDVHLDLTTHVRAGRRKCLPQTTNWQTNSLQSKCGVQNGARENDALRTSYFSSPPGLSRTTTEHVSP